MMNQLIFTNTLRSCAQRLLLLSGAAFILIVFSLLNPAMAATKAMQPYTATYKIKALGLPVGNSIQHLRTNKGQYISSSLTQLRVAFLNYQVELKSYGRFTDDSIIPDKFYFNRESKNRKRGWELYLSPDRSQITTTEYDSDKPGQDIKRQYTIDPAWVGSIQDGISQQLQVRLDLAHLTDKTLHYVSAERKEAYARTYRIVGTEKINTGIGKLNTLKLEYEEDGETSAVWLDKDRQYLPVQVTYNASNNIQGTATIDSLKYYKDGE